MISSPWIHDADTPKEGTTLQRRSVTVQGTVQGVGFRPFIYSLAQQFGVSGFVRNEAGVVLMELQGPCSQLDEFLCEVERRPPPLARIAKLSWRQLPPLPGEDEFAIKPSFSEAAEQIWISPDVATCDDCLRELFDPTDRRYRYPFVNCTNCGPRLTFIEDVPYDRSRTTMAGFPLCPECLREYNHPADRRFHAEAVACPNCGPQLELCRSDATVIAIDEPLVVVAEMLRRGKIVALKGLGGYHVACDALHDPAVSELRRRKQRDEKPFAVMVRSLAEARQYCEVNSQEAGLLTSLQRPIVLLRKRTGQAPRVAEAVAPGNPWLGVMLPYTPLHHLLLDALGERPLVMTSGNRSEEPIVHCDEHVFERLGGIADFILRHNRPIHLRCDDSVVRSLDGQACVMRRSRGYVPVPLELPLECPLPMLAVGGQLKNVFALGNGNRALLSHHLGDLDEFTTYSQFVRDISLYERLFQWKPELLVHDSHPDYASTGYAQKRASEQRLPTLSVQHHHAHMASCMAEHGLDEPVLGVIFDGTGFGFDTSRQAATVWGGEFLLGDYRQFRRAAHLQYVPMPGGERAVDEPWRMALAHLWEAGLDDHLLTPRIPREKIHTVRTMLERQFNSPLTSSAGRLFDAVAALVGLRDRVTYEGQAAIELEWIASEYPAQPPYPFQLLLSDDRTRSAILDTRPMIRAVHEDVLRGSDGGRIARRFHATLVEMIARTCQAISEQTGIRKVVLSGGVFLNTLIATEASERLSSAGFTVYRHRHVPPGDGGLSLGQLAVAAAKWRASGEGSAISRNAGQDLQPLTT